MGDTTKKPEEFRLSYVFLGLMIGFFVGAGLVYWYYNSQNDRPLYLQAWNYFSGLGAKSSPSSSPIAEPGAPAMQAPSRALAAAATPVGKPASSAEPAEEDASLLESMHETPPGDAPLPDSVSVSREEEFLLMQDRLLQIRVFSVRQPESALNDHQRLLDSLIGGRPSRAASSSVRIEFWASPLQYMGYKRSRNRVIIYGLEHPQLAQLQVNSAGMFLRYMDHLYELAENSSFQPLISVFEQQELEQYLFP